MMPLFFFLFFLLYGGLCCADGLYYHSAWNRLPEFILPEKQASVFISVIIAARNEEANINGCFNLYTISNIPKNYMK